MPLTNVIIEIHLVLLFTLHTPRIILNIAYHITEVLIFYADKLAVPKIRVHLISRFCLNRENLMLAKYTCFTVLSSHFLVEYLLVGLHHGVHTGSGRAHNHNTLASMPVSDRLKATENGDSAALWVLVARERTLLCMIAVRV